MLNRTKNQERWYRLKRAVRYWWQRRTRGWDDSETWTLYSSLGEWMTPRLKRFIEIHDCVPHGMTEEEWIEILQKITQAFELLEQDRQYDDGTWGDCFQYYEAICEGLELFRIHAMDLWW